MSVTLLILWLICIFGFVLAVHRWTTPRELDDVHPAVVSTENPRLKESLWLWVIPLYNNDPISAHPEWVDKLKNSGKKLGLHGVYHPNKEFGTDRSDEYIDTGIAEFEKAFGFYPTHFKAPNLALSEGNAEKLRKRGIKIKGLVNQAAHIVFHVTDYDVVPGYPPERP
jgi:predicted deacetylase